MNGTRPVYRCATAQNYRIRAELRVLLDPGGQSVWAGREIPGGGAGSRKIRITILMRISKRRRRRGQLTPERRHQ